MDLLNGFAGLSVEVSLALIEKAFTHQSRSICPAKSVSYLWHTHHVTPSCEMQEGLGRRDESGEASERWPNTETESRRLMKAATWKSDLGYQGVCPG